MSDPTKTIEIIRQWTDAVATRSLHDHARYVKANGLSLPQFFVLMQLHHRGLCGVTDIGDRMEITSAAASQLIERLVQMGLVERTEDPADRRAKQLALTGKGRALIEKGIIARSQWIENLTKALTAEQQAMIVSALTLLTAVARKTEE